MLNFGKFTKILILIYTICQISPSFAVKPRIVGGTITTINKEPYIVQLLSYEKFICGGTLLSSEYVVTAAHCVKDRLPSSLTIVAGASKLSEFGVRSKVSKIMIPKGFTAFTMNVDVAVLKLSLPLTGTNIQPISLCTKIWPVGSQIRVSGWGYTSENATGPSNEMRTVLVTSIEKSTCTAEYKSKIALSPSMSCASVPGEKDACSGDSGGPAVYNGQLCGVVSWGIGCASKAYPGVYTNVVAVRKFLQNAMAK